MCSPFAVWYNHRFCLVPNCVHAPPKETLSSLVSESENMSDHPFLRFSNWEAVQPLSEPEPWDSRLCYHFFGRFLLVCKLSLMSWLGGEQQGALRLLNFTFFSEKQVKQISQNSVFPEGNGPDPFFLCHACIQHTRHLSLSAHFHSPLRGC